MANELKLITPVNDVFRRDVELADTALLNPNAANPLRQGEWVVPGANGWERVSATTGTTKNAKMVWTERGDFPAQAIGKVTVLQLHQFECETLLFDSDWTPALGDPVTVQKDDVTGIGTDLSVFAEAETGEFVYGYVTKVPADNGGWLGVELAAAVSQLN
jgi:hypothetical protein